MANYLTDDAICLRVGDFSETSQIVGLFTRRHGLVPMIAKGSKRHSEKGTTGKVSGPLDLLTAGEVVFIPAKGAAELGTLAGWELTDPRTGLRKRLAGLNGGLVCAEVTLALVHPHDPHEELFGELEAALELLGLDRLGPPSAGAGEGRAVVGYVKAALVAAGYGPELGACVVCGGGVGSGEVRFSARAGGVVCGKCAAQGAIVTAGFDKLSPPITAPGRVVAALARLGTPRQLLAAPPERAGEPGALRLALEMLLAQVEALVDRALKTRALLGSVFKG